LPLYLLSAILPFAMPRHARLDAPGTLHQVMVRGWERRASFRDDTDRAAFVARLASLAEQGALTIYAWALLPNHAPLLLRSGAPGLPQFMRRLLTGYALGDHRRHQRVGHLFQHRYTSSWAAVRAIRQRAARVLADERILGTGPFVERLLAAGAARQQTQRARAHRLRDAQALIRRQCRQAQLGLEELRMGSRRRRIAAVRAHLAVHLVTQLGLSLADTARQLGVSTSGIAKALARAERPIVH
jgi:hypothetical protein